MKGAVEFYLSFLVKNPKHKWLVVCPSVSPENSPSVASGIIHFGRDDNG
jgi:alpha-L-fucosidase 2